ncbi:MAG: CoA-binding protein [Bdellovibrionales bacterium]
MSKSATQPAFENTFLIESLSQIATAKDRICVLNILGKESRGVTPVSHAYSGGNIVFGTSPGKRGESLGTPIGGIPVYNNVREGLADGHKFNTGVVYLPPAAVRDGVFEFIRVNEALEKVVILTEKVPVRDAREIRAFALSRRVQVFGGNSLGVADSWNHIRIGGALGGDTPEETLCKGSVAIYSNSGNFTTTIASYLRTAGWGTTTCVSSGKDLYIFFAPDEFAHAFNNDERSKAAVMYVEPGGYYEERLDLRKPVVACVVGRWKSKLTRAVGHAGALAQGEDNAEAKERWFMRHFGVDAIFTPDNPVVSAKGAVVTDIAHIPLALTAVMKKNGINPDFAAEGDLSLKPWFGGNAGIALPQEFDLKPVRAIAPYDSQIEELTHHVGAVFPRQNMKDMSSSSIMDPETQVTRVSGVSVLDAAGLPLEANLCLPLTREVNDANDNALFDIAVAAGLNLHGDPAAVVADAVRDAGNAPNATLAAAVCAIGPSRVEPACAAADVLIDLFAHKAKGKAPELTAERRAVLLGAAPDARAAAMLKAYKARGAKSEFVDYLVSLGGHPTADAVLAALTTTIAWDALMTKRIARGTVRNLPWYARIFAAIIGASAPAAKHTADTFCGVAMAAIYEKFSATEMAYLALFGEKPEAAQLFPFQTMLGLIISNGPGTISAQAAKAAVSADGPEQPDRVQINKAMAAFLTGTGFAHGGNGFEGIEFLVERFRDATLKDAGSENHGIDLKAVAAAYAKRFKAEKAARKAVGEEAANIPGINHPVFKGQPVNHDPREVYLEELFRKRGEFNVFHAFYRVLVQVLFDTGVTKNVFCVNIDAVIAALLLKLVWPRYVAGTFTGDDLRNAAFTAFLFGRMAGCAGEIDDHINRGRNMDTRTPASKCGFVT